jgi:hypothetical protein
MTDRNPATAAKSAKQEPAKGDDGKTVNRDKSSNAAASGNQKTPAKKRRKVNHGTSLQYFPPLASKFLVVFHHALVDESTLWIGSEHPDARIPRCSCASKNLSPRPINSPAYQSVSSQSWQQDSSWRICLFQTRIIWADCGILSQHAYIVEDLT